MNSIYLNYEGDEYIFDIKKIGKITFNDFKQIFKLNFKKNFNELYITDENNIIINSSYFNKIIKNKKVIYVENY
jgi:hypothetical protein